MTAVPLERHVRSKDPQTSWDAAQGITPEAWTALMFRVHEIVADSPVPLTRDQIFTIYNETRIDHKAPRRSPQRIRSAIANLLDGIRVDFGSVKVCTIGLRVADMEGRSDAGNRAERLEVVRW